MFTQNDNHAKFHNKAFEYANRLSNLGLSFLDKRELDKAEKCFSDLLKIAPTSSATHNNLGLVHLAQGKSIEAIADFTRSMELSPNDVEAYYHLGLTYNDIGNLVEAAKYFERALEINPNLGHTLNMYTNLLLQTCNWTRYREIQERLSAVTLEEIEKGLPISEAPFVNILTHQNSKLNFKVAKSKSLEIKNRTAGAVPPLSFKANKKHKKIRVAYLSRDFCNHATAYLILGLFEIHDRKKFEVFAYSYGPNDKSSYRQKLEKDADHFIDIARVGYVETAKIINEDQIDILVDLKGHTKDNRLEIASFRPTPIQVSWLGFPGTTGADFIDYILADKIVTPPSVAKYYTEKFVYLPDCYQINYDKRKIAKINFQRSDLGLPPGSFVFSCFNHTIKINPEAFASWMRILKKVPKSILWLLESNPIAAKNLKKEAQKAGVSPNRLIFAEYLANDRHLGRIKLSDLNLDTFTYNGHTTTSDCLWAGVPVVTLMGKHFASRVSASLLTAIGLPELIAKDQIEYEMKAITLAKNPKKLNAIRSTLNANRLTKLLFDTRRFVFNLEKAYTEMWAIYLQGQKPRQITVKES